MVIAKIKWCSFLTHRVECYQQQVSSQVVVVTGHLYYTTVCGDSDNNNILNSDMHHVATFQH